MQEADTMLTLEERQLRHETSLRILRQWHGFLEMDDTYAVLPRRLVDIGYGVRIPVPSQRIIERLQLMSAS